MVKVRTKSIVSGLACAGLLAALPACKKQEGAAKGAAKTAETRAAEPAPEPPMPEPPKPFTPEERAAFYAACWTNLNDRKWDDFGKCFADDVVSEHVDSGRPPVQGKQAHEMPKAFFSAFPDMKGSNVLTLVNGNKVAAVYHLVGTHTADLTMGPGNTIPATNKKVGYLMGHVVEFGDDNLVHKEWVFSDAGTFMYQLGLAKQPGRPVLEKVEAPPAVVIAKDDDAERANLEASKKVTDGWNKHDKTFVDGYADDAVEVDVSMPADTKGKKAILAAAQTVWKGFSDARGELVDAWAAGDYTIAVARNTGTNDADVKEWKLKKTGKPVSFTSLQIIRWEGGKVKQSWFVANMLAVAQQLGMAPPPGDAAAGTAGAPVAEGDKPAAPHDAHGDKK